MFLVGRRKLDESIIQQAQIGDQEAFRQLVEAYHVSAWRTARVLLPAHLAIEDVLQEAWLDVWRGLPRFQRERQFRPWLLTIVANRCRMALRRRNLATVALDDAEVEQIEAVDDVLAHILRQEADGELQLALETLSAEQRCALELRFFADLELSEIALITNAPLGTVKSRLHRALHNLRLHLRPATTPWKEAHR